MIPLCVIVFLLDFMHSSAGIGASFKRVNCFVSIRVSVC